eukprot:2417351-Rhodomonas_salina.4
MGMSGTDIAYGTDWECARVRVALSPLLSDYQATSLGYQPMRLLRAVRYCPSIWCYHPMRVQCAMLMLATDVINAATGVCSCYAVSGADIAYGATRRTVF